MIVTGMSTSRLSELKKYRVSDTFSEQYFQSQSSQYNGVNMTKSTYPSKIVYYVDKITYIDYIDQNGNNKTKFSFEGQGYNSPDFVNLPILKDPNKSNLINKPKIQNDVFIKRQELSVFEKNYKLGYIKSLRMLINYGSGKYFNVVNYN